MKNTMKRLLCMILAAVMFVSMLPAQAHAWKYKTHGNSAELIMLDMIDSKKNVEIHVPYDDYSEEGTFEYKIPDEFYRAITEYPEAFRAGALGPDFYPDILIGQAYIHPYDADANIGSGTWLPLLVESANRLPQYSAQRLEALSFTLGYMLHYCGDLFGHDFVNTFSGGTFPSVTDVDITDTTNPELNNILSHMSLEGYMDDLVNDDFYDYRYYSASGRHAIKAPTKFITDSMVLNNNMSNGVADIYYTFKDDSDDSLLGGIPAHIDKIVSFRNEIMAFADEYRPYNFYGGLTAYADEWAQDIDRALYGLVDAFDMIAYRLMTGAENPEIEEETVWDWVVNGYPIEKMLEDRFDIEKIKSDDNGTISIILEELSLWVDKYGWEAVGIPAIIANGLPEWVDYIFWPFTLPLDIAVSGLKDILGLIITEILYAAVGPTVKLYTDAAALLKDRLEDPEVQLDHPDNPYKPSEDNFAELKEYMDRYAAEQELLDGQTELTLLTDYSGTDILGQLMDSDFEAFYNTMVMFKLILMGPDNFSQFIRDNTGIRQMAYKNNTGELEATVLKLIVTTYDTEYAGTDDNVYCLVGEKQPDGSYKEVTRKLLDNPYDNDLEAGDSNIFYIDLPKPLKLDEIELFFQQNGTATANGGWDCESVTVIPMHAGVELTEPIGLGGNLHMDEGKFWQLEFQKALNLRGTTINAQTPVTHALIRIQTGKGDYLDGTDYDVDISAVSSDNEDYVVKDIPLDKYMYNDFEDGDDDVYFVPLSMFADNSGVATLPTVGNLTFVIKHHTDYEWVAKNIQITPYYGNLPLTEPVDFGETVFSDSNGKYQMFSLQLRNSANKLTFKQYSPIQLTYTTALDEGVLEYMLSLDAGVQWENLPVLWDTAEGRKLFFKLFKGFRPKVEIMGSYSDAVDYGDPLNIVFYFTGVWNGVDWDRRNALAEYAQETFNDTTYRNMYVVSGTADITFTNIADGTEYVITVPVKNTKATLDETVSNPLPVGEYEIKINYYADEKSPWYSDMEHTFSETVVVSKKISTVSYMVRGYPSTRGTGIVTGSGRYAKGSALTLEAKPRTGYKFKKWLVGGRELPKEIAQMFGSTYQITNLTQPMMIEAVFEPETYAIKTSVGSKGGSVELGGNYQYGSSATVIATPFDNYMFAGWYENGERVSNSASYTFTVEGDRDLTAEFLKRFYMDIILPGSQDDGTECGYGIVIDRDVLRDHLLGDNADLEVPDSFLEGAINDAGNTLKIEVGTRFSFTVVPKEGYKKTADFAVRANGELLTADENGYFTFNVNESKEITVEGIALIEYTPKPVINYTETDDGIIFEAQGEGEVILYVNGKPVQNPYTLKLKDETVGFAAYATAQAPGKEVSEPATLTGNIFDSHVAFPVTINDSEHGKVEVDEKYDAPGVETQLTVTPDEGYRLKELVVECEGVSLEVKEIEGTYRFVRPSGCATITAVFEPSGPFTDVPAGSFYYEPVLWAVENGVTTGATETTFNPNGNCLRAHVVTFLHRANSNPEPTSTRNPFTDVKSSDFFYKPVLWAVEKGITNGTSATTFGSYDNCNRAAVVTFLWRNAGSPEPKSTKNPFVDVKSTDFFYKPVLWAVEQGITNGLDATHFGPIAACNRAQVVTFLYRAYNG